MIGIKNFILGYFLVTPNEDRTAYVYDLLLNHGIEARRTKSGAFVIREKYRKKLEKPASENSLEFSEIKGLPYYIIENRKRYGIFAALLICAFLFFFVRGRVWNIRVQGASTDTENKILSALAAEGASEGVPFRSLDFSEIENGVLRACPSVAWLNVHRRGTVMYVNIIESQTGDVPNNNEIGNIVASEDCVIIEISPDRGVASVSVGDAVQKGDLLISAVHPDGTVSGASGTVRGRVSSEISAHAFFRENKKILEKIKTTEITINFFDFSINIFKNYRNLPNGYDIIKSERQLRLFGRISLPISATVRSAHLQREQTVHLSEEETVRLAGVRLRAELSRLMSKGELESLRTVGAFTQEGYVFTAYYEQIRNIVELKPIYVG